MARRQRDGVVDLAQACASAEAIALVDLGWPELRISLTAKLSLLGVPGCGKSTGASGMVTVAAEVYGVMPLYLSVEEGTGQTALARFERIARQLGIPVPGGILISDPRDVAEADADLAAYERRLGDRRGFVVVDSVSDLRAPEGWWRSLLASRHGVVFVEHVVTSGAAKGGLETLFAVDTVIVVEQGGLATPVKSRWGKTGPDHTFDVHHPRLPRQVLG